MTRDVNLLTFTSLYPSSARPRHGIFIESRLQGLLQRGGLKARVVAPVPWFPFTGDRWGEYGRVARTPQRELRQGVDVRYPRYPSLPYVGYARKPQLMARAGLRAIEGLLREGATIDAIDAHYLYPDGVAAAEIARELRKPFVLSARGTDVNVIAQLPGPMRRIRDAIDASAGVIAVSAALKASLVALGVAAERITVLRNGVDPDLFFPEDPLDARRKLGLPVDPKIALSVGNLVAEKRHEMALEAVLGVEDLKIVFVGRGPARPRLERMAHERGSQDRAWFFEEMPQARLRLVYSAADVLVLSSEREGWPNVVLEAAACGTPAVAFPVGGVPEILGDPALGLMVSGTRDVRALRDAIRTLIANRPSRASVRAAAIRFAWDPVLEAQLALYRAAARLDDGAPAGLALETARA